MLQTPTYGEAYNSSRNIDGGYQPGYQPGYQAPYQPEYQPGYQGEYYDTEAQDYIDDTKYGRQIRHGFIRKVYGILAAQLILTSAMGALFTLHAPAQLWILGHYWVTLVTCIAAIVLLLVLACVPSVARSVPTNYIILTLFTACESVGVGGACALAAKHSGGIIVLQAALATCIITIGLTVFAFQTKYDFTSYMAGMFYITLGLSIFALMTIFFRSNLITGILSGVFALVMCVYLVMDTQLMIGNGKVRASEDDYILAAVLLYLDIVNIFLYLLKILQSIKN